MKLKKPLKPKTDLRRIMEHAILILLFLSAVAWIAIGISEDVSRHEQAWRERGYITKQAEDLKGK
jgi:uncharacterized membrane protein YcjF (UPF0283 family)